MCSGSPGVRLKAATKPPVRCYVTAGTDLRDRDVDISSQPKLSIDAK